MRRFTWIITLPVTLLVILFVAFNRAPVSLNLWPLPWDIQAPLYLFTLGVLLFGFLLGALVTWVSGAKTRRRLREASRIIANKSKEISMLRKDPGAATGAHMPPAPR